jgi:hypothetical protein
MSRPQKNVESASNLERKRAISDCFPSTGIRDTVHRLQY